MAIEGIDRKQAEAVLACGMGNVAVVSAITRAPDWRLATSTLQSITAEWGVTMINEPRRSTADVDRLHEAKGGRSSEVLDDQAFALQPSAVVARYRRRWPTTATGSNGAAGKAWRTGFAGRAVFGARRYLPLTRRLPRDWLDKQVVRADLVLDCSDKWRPVTPSMPPVCSEGSPQLAPVQSVSAASY